MATLNSLVLMVHIAGSLAVLAFVVASFASVIQSKTSRFAFLAKYLGFATLFQVISGSILMLLSLGSMSVLNFCGLVAFYMGVVFITESVLFFKMRSNAIMQFPRQSLATSFAVTMGAFLLTVIISL